MKYKYSHLDRKNFGWFQNDFTRKTLRKIDVRVGSIRGLEDIVFNFYYPITTIAGKNGSGKSTALALAACGFHNKKDGFKTLGRKKTYYTFSDFFIQTEEEVPPEGIGILYDIMSEYWYNKKTQDTETKIGTQLRKKRKGGRWNNYDLRVNRNVVYFGIDRVVPHSEKSVSKSYRKRFKKIDPLGVENEVMKLVGRILENDYSDFKFKKHSKYRIAVVNNDGKTYSGFNMGAGEDALFEILTTLKLCPDGTLILVDEIELGLHAEAQKKLIQTLKEICLDKKIQIICTTHSPTIIDCLPPEGKIYIEQLGKKKDAIVGISSAYATGKLSGDHSNELHILVEDEVAETLIKSCLDLSTRKRARVIPVGSFSAVVRHLAMRYKEGFEIESLSFLDGDKEEEKADIIKLFVDSLENSTEEKSAKKWIKERLNFLPGKEWPEKWILDKTLEKDKEYLVDHLGCGEENIVQIIKKGLRSGKHNEFYTISKEIELEENYIRQIFIDNLAKNHGKIFKEVRSIIASALD